MNVMPLFRRLKGRKYQLPVVIFYVRPLVSVNSCCINLNHTGPDSIQVTITSYNIYQTQKLLVIQSCCINLGHTGPDGAQVTITSYHQLQYLPNSKTSSTPC